MRATSQARAALLLALALTVCALALCAASHAAYVDRTCHGVGCPGCAYYRLGYTQASPPGIIEVRSWRAIMRPWERWQVRPARIQRWEG